MAFYDRVRVSLTSRGVGPLAIGAAARGYRSFADAGVPDQAVVSYVIEDRGGTYELGTGTYDAATNTLSRVVSASSSAGNPINVSAAGVLFLSPLARDLATIIASRGAVDAGKLVQTGPLGGIDPSALKRGAALRVDRITLSYADVETVPLNLGSDYVIPTLQNIVVDATSATTSGASNLWVVGNTRKGAIRHSTRLRGPLGGPYEPCRKGDLIEVHEYRASSAVSGSIGHTAAVNVYVARDATISQGEVAGYWALSIGTGYSVGQNPNDASFGMPEVMGVNCYLQIIHSNRFKQVADFKDLDFMYPAHENYAPNNAKEAVWGFTLTGAVLRDVPALGCFEHDANGRLFITGLRNGATVRERISVEQLGEFTVTIGNGAGTGGTITQLTKGPNCGSFLVTVGSNPFIGGAYATITYTTPFTNNSWVVIGPSNAPAAISDASATADKNGFTIAPTDTSNQVAGAKLRFTFFYRGD